MPYKHILVAVDYSNDAGKVLGKALEIAQASSSTLHIVHVVEPIDVTGPYDLAPILPLELDQQLEQRAKDFLQKLLEEQKATNVTATVKIGSIKSELFALAQELGIDLIVIGTHGRHGVGLLLGSTATSVLHGTPCDVLAVRI
jgi:universal stress protein A